VVPYAALLNLLLVYSTQVGMMLRGMGFDNTTSLYIASGKIYNPEKYMTPLRKLFPLLQTKETLALPEELTQFKVHFFPS
jgi:aromatic ring hydroxylase